MITVIIETVGRVEARLVQRYLDGTVRVSYQGREYIAKEVA